MFECRAQGRKAAHGGGCVRYAMAIVCYRSAPVDSIMLQVAGHRLAHKAMSLMEPGVAGLDAVFSVCRISHIISYHHITCVVLCFDRSVWRCSYGSCDPRLSVIDASALVWANPS